MWGLDPKTSPAWEIVNLFCDFPREYPNHHPGEQAKWENVLPYLMKLATAHLRMEESWGLENRQWRACLVVMIPLASKILRCQSLVPGIFLFWTNYFQMVNTENISETKQEGACVYSLATITSLERTHNWKTKNEHYHCYFELSINIIYEHLVVLPFFLSFPPATLYFSRHLGCLQYITMELGQ